MWGRIRNLFRGGVTASADPTEDAIEAAKPKSDTIPAELVAAIDNACVVWRTFQPDQDKDLDAERAAVVMIVGIGSFRLGLKPTEQVVANCYPDLSPAACRKAGRLIEAVVAQRNYEAHRRIRPRKGWDVMEGVPTWHR
jgi:hypothetical protein